jgi:hypothetical protein
MLGSNLGAASANAKGTGHDYLPHLRLFGVKTADGR